MATKALALVSITAVAGLAAAVPAHAEVRLTIQNGRVSLVAKDATLKQILAEWAKVGQTTIVNGERVPGGPLTLQLADVPEEQALDTLLRALSGYVAAPRATAAAGLSRFDRIVVMPTVAAPVSGAAPASGAGSTAASSRFPQPIRPAPGPPEQVAQPLPLLEEYPPDDEANWNRGPAAVLQPQLAVDVDSDPEPPSMPNELSPGRGLLVLPPGSQPADAAPTVYPGMPTAPAGVAVPGMPTSAPAPRQPAPAPRAVPPGEEPL